MSKTATQSTDPTKYQPAEVTPQVGGRLSTSVMTGSGRSVLTSRTEGSVTVRFTPRANSSTPTDIKTK